MVEMFQLADSPAWTVSFYKDENAWLPSEFISSKTYQTKEEAIKAASVLLSAGRPNDGAIYFQISNYIFQGCTAGRRVIV